MKILDFSLTSLSVVFATLQAFATNTVDFSQTKATIRPQLHGANCSAAFATSSQSQYDHYLNEMNLQVSRTHDWALVNAGQRVIDVHWVFPLLNSPTSDDHVDDPAYYNFKATDEIIRLTKQNVGCDIFFRLGNSIDKTDRHYNADKPISYEKWARVCANIIRHYNEGLWDGFHYNIKYWEIWNEPELESNSCWNGTWSEFCTFFATAINHFKTQFPSSNPAYADMKFGGPAMSVYNVTKFKELASACKKNNRLPDFFSWHHYGPNVSNVTAKSASLKKSLKGTDSSYSSIETVIDEWHWMDSGWSSTTAQRQGIDSAAFTAACHCEFQNTADADKFMVACHYGYGLTGSFGFLDSSYNPHNVYYALKMAGEVVTSCTTVCKSTQDLPVYILAAKSADGCTGKMLVAAYKDTTSAIGITLAGLGTSPESTITKVERITGSASAPTVRTDWTVTDGVLTLPKPAASSVFLVTFNIPAL